MEPKIDLDQSAGFRVLLWAGTRLLRKNLLVLLPLGTDVDAAPLRAAKHHQKKLLSSMQEAMFRMQFLRAGYYL